MSPRPRKASDEEIFAATTRVMGRLGPGQITLADVAAEAGLTAGALVQRFGSKRALLLTLMERYAGSAREMFDGLRRSAGSPLATLHAYARCMAQMGQTPDALAHHLAWLQQDLTDPEFRKHMLVQAQGTRRELQRLVREAVIAGELVDTVRPAALVRAIELTITGSLMTWAIHQEGSAAAWLRHDLKTTLDPWRPPERKGSK